MWPTEIGTKGDSARGWRQRTDVEPLRTPSALLELLDRQAGRCAVCAEGLVVAPNAPDALTGVVDRDSLTEAVRGLLCHRCHEGLTLFGGNAELLRRAAGYLRSAPDAAGPVR